MNNQGQGSFHTLRFPPDYDGQAHQEHNSFFFKKKGRKAEKQKKQPQGATRPGRQRWSAAPELTFGRQEGRFAVHALVELIPHLGPLAFPDKAAEFTGGLMLERGHEHFHR